MKKLYQFCFVLLVAISLSGEAKCAEARWCDFLKSVRRNAKEKNGLQAGIAVDNRQNLFTFSADLGGRGETTALEVMQAGDKQGLKLKTCEVGFGLAVCALAGTPKPAASYDCSKEYCFTPNFWSFYLLKSDASTWVFSEKGIKEAKVSDGDILGFAWVAKEGGHPSRSPLPAPSECR